MLRQQELVQARETIAARDAEVEELKARVADLETLRQQQQQLISMKDSELAAAQQRLADSNAQPAPTLASTQTPAQSAQTAATQVPWIWIGVGLLALALLAWWFASRRSTASNKASRSFLADAEPAPVAQKPVMDAPAQVSVPEPEPAVSKADAATVMAASGWPNVPAAVEPAKDDLPPWHAAGNGAAQAATIAPLNPAPAGQERLELARAYIDLGDVDTARTLLQEVADTGDAASRGEASRLLRELV